MNPQQRFKLNRTGVASSKLRVLDKKLVLSVDENSAPVKLVYIKIYDYSATETVNLEYDLVHETHKRHGKFREGVIYYICKLW